MTDTTGPYELIDLALRLLPEDEGIDLGDRDWTVDQMVDLRDRLGRIRKAVDIVNLAIADRFATEVPVGYSTLVEGGMIARVSETTRKPIWIDGTGEQYAAWLQTTPTVEEIAGWMSTVDRVTQQRRPRLTGMPRAAKDTFVDWEPESAKATLKVFPVAQATAKWLGTLEVGDVARWTSGHVEHLGEEYTT